MVLPGKSFAGKTTLVAALVRAGAEYWSDEYAVLDANGDVHPYAGCWRDQVAGVHDCGPRARPDQALAAVSRAATDAVVLEGERGEAEETAAALISTLATSVRKPTQGSRSGTRRLTRTNASELWTTWQR
jgi:hypothetical protein